MQGTTNIKFDLGVTCLLDNPDVGAALWMRCGHCFWSRRLAPYSRRHVQHRKRSHRLSVRVSKVSSVAQCTVLCCISVSVSLPYSLFAFTLFRPLFSPFNLFLIFEFCYNFPLFSSLFLHSLLLWSCSRLSLVLSFPFIVFHSCSSVSFIFLLIVFPFYLISLTCLNLSFSVSPTLYSILALFSLVHSLISFSASYPISTSVWFLSFSTFDLPLPPLLYLCLFVFFFTYSLWTRAGYTLKQKKSTENG